MKRILSLLAMLIAVNFSYAQWTTSGSNTTTTDNVGVGTTSPESGFRFDVNGLGAIGTQGNARIYMGTTDATNAFIQARDNSINQNLTFSAASYNFAVGNVGIGTTSPGSLLHLYSSGADNMLRLQFNASGGGNWSINPFIYGINNGGLSFVNIQSSTTPFVIDASDNVGIGTTSPQNKLDVQGGNVGIYNTGSASTLAVGSGATGKTVLLLSTSADENGYSTITSVAANGSSYGNMVINPSEGCVGIGTTDPKGHKLAVNGDIIATKVLVTPYANWPDYVFKPQYKLPSLAEVKTYIDQNQHLPEVPSAATVEKDGQDLGEINKVLLKKVEELTLYLIEQKAEINDLKRSQQKQIDELQSQVELLLKHK